MDGRGPTVGRSREDPIEIDLRTFPIDSILRQAVDVDPDQAAHAWRLLGSMARSGRREAEAALLGLMQTHREDLPRMAVLVDAISRAGSEAAAKALQAEFLRVPSTPRTRSYLQEALRALVRLPEPLAVKALERLAADRRVSPRWRRRLEEAADALSNDVRADGPRFEE